MESPRFQVVNVYGPVPSALFARSDTPFGDIMAPILVVIE